MFIFHAARKPDDIVHPGRTLKKNFQLLNFDAHPYSPPRRRADHHTVIPYTEMAEKYSKMKVKELQGKALLKSSF